MGKRGRGRGRVLLGRLSWGELGFKVELGVDLLSGSGTPSCVVCLHVCVCRLVVLGC
jgi:hypothetical protein